MAADVHRSHGGTKVARKGAQKSKLSATAASEPPNLDEIVKDNDFTVIATKKDTR
jgi:hypothetical protein